MRIVSALRSSRLAKVTLLVAGVSLLGADLLQDAVANGDTRTLTLRHVHSGDSDTVTFKRNGRYDPAALQRLNVLLQDWRRKQPTKMDPQLFDILWEVYRETGATRPIEVIGGYRSPETNAMLRARSRGVAQTSLHMQGKAIDFYIPGVPLAKLREAGLRLQRGGVGFYPTSGSPFVHMDTGGVRHWPRMTRTELARVFPNGKTVHVPTDGKPMARYDVALAEVESRKSGASSTASAPRPAGKNFLASLFGKEEDDEESAAPATATRAQVAAAPVPVAVPAPVVVAAAPVAVPPPQPNPLPRSTTVALASAPVLAPAPDVSPVVEVPVIAAAAPRPLPRPAGAPKLSDALLQVASAPRPQARPVEAAALPELIVGAGGAEGPVLAYASASTGLFPRERLQPGRAPVAAAPAQASHAAAPRNARTASYSAEMQAEIRRLFSSPTVATHVVLHTPELRRFASFVAPPRQVVAGGFGHDGSNGLNTTRFEGAAVVAVPVVAMAGPVAPVARKL